MNEKAITNSLTSEDRIFDLEKQVEFMKQTETKCTLHLQSDEPSFTPIAATIEEGITCANMKSAQKLEKYVTEVNAWMKWAREKIKAQDILIEKIFKEGVS